VRFDPRLELMMDGPHGEVAFQVFEGFLDLNQQHVEVRRFARGLWRKGSSAAGSDLRAAWRCAFVFAQRVGQRAVVVDVDLAEPPRERALCLGCAELEQECVARRGHAREFAQACPEFFELAAAHGPLLGDAIHRAGEHVEPSRRRDRLP
jgi:hypothetical protein